MGAGLDDRAVRPRTQTAGSAWIRAGLGLLCLDLLLIAPNRPDALTLEALRMVPLELPVAVLALVVLPRAWARRLAWGLALALTLAGALKLADLASYTGFGRPFKPVTDPYLLEPAWAFAADMLGPVAAGMAAVAALLVVALLGWLALWSARAIADLGQREGRRRAVVAALALGVAVGAGETAQRLAQVDARTDAFTSTLVADRVAQALATQRALIRFRARVADAAARDDGPDDALARLAGRDVLFAFVESYGRDAVESPAYAGRARPALRRLARAAAGKGLAVRSAWLEAPTVGGSSWLSHATLLSGLWIDSQPRHDALLASERPTLIDLFAARGWRTVAAVPAIQGAWPAGEAFGYDRVLDAAALDYAGRPFNWVTMPDQYTLDALHRLELADPGDPPVFAEIALISSHAPWTPVPELVPWDAVGDGTVFDRFAARGDPPEVVWRDPERVRRQYTKALGYALDVVADFTRARLDPDSVLLVLGDHQPAPLITGPDAGRQVPVHLIAPPAVLAAVRDWGWTAGAVPAADAPVWRMDAVRARFEAAFSGRDAAPSVGPRTAGDGTS